MVQRIHQSGILLSEAAAKRPPGDARIHIAGSVKRRTGHQSGAFPRPGYTDQARPKGGRGPRRKRNVSVGHHSKLPFSWVLPSVRLHRSGPPKRLRGSSFAIRPCFVPKKSQNTVAFRHVDESGRAWFGPPKCGLSPVRFRRTGGAKSGGNFLGFVGFVMFFFKTTFSLMRRQNFFCL